jgi:hypothetical protein
MNYSLVAQVNDIPNAIIRLVSLGFVGIRAPCRNPGLPYQSVNHGIGWVPTRFPRAKKLVGYTGLCPRVRQPSEANRRGPLSKQGHRYLRWAMLEATMHASRHPVYSERYQRNKQRLGKQRGAHVAQVDLARKLTEAIWHMLTHNQPFDPAGAAAGAALRVAA